MTESSWQAVYKVVRRIPEGQVSTYGAIATLSGMPRAARQVGWALNALGSDPSGPALPETGRRVTRAVAVRDDVPWHRVINAQGKISARGERAIEDLQRALLEGEGVVFDDRGRVDLEAFGWKPRRRARPPRKEASEAASKKGTKTTQTSRAPKASQNRTKRSPHAAARNASRSTGAR